MDLETARLERTLAPLRYRNGTRSRCTAGWLLAGAVAAIACVLVWLASPLPHPAQQSGWTIATAASETRRLLPGAVVETDSTQTVELHSRSLGMVSVEPQSRLRLLPNAGSQQRLALDYGTLRAFIVAPPARFAVDTPAATAVDLGCVYTLQSSRDGNGKLTVEAGWVALQADNRESFIPAGAQADIRRNTGPGLPMWKDAGAVMQQAVARFDEGDLQAFREVLAAARPKDALTLWHLLPRAEASSRTRVATQFAAYVSLPEGVTAADLAALRPAAMDAAWGALGLGETSWWRTWKRQW